MRVRRNISIDEETARKLVELAEKSHKNVSQWITDRVWENDNAMIKKVKKGNSKDE